MYLYFSLGNNQKAEIVNLKKIYSKIVSWSDERIHIFSKDQQFDIQGEFPTVV